MRFAQFVQSATLLLLFAVGLAMPAHAQANKPIISGTWYEDRASGFTANNQILLTLAQTPANKLLNITHVACTINTKSTQALLAVDLDVGSTSGSVDLFRPYPIRGNVSPQVTNSTNSWSVVTDRIFYKVGPGRYPSINILTSSDGASYAINATCIIVGELSDS